MMGPKTISAKYCEALNVAEANPRSAVGNQEATILPLPGNTGAWANPAITRSANKTANAVVNPITREQADQITMPAP